jgi:hypothetical protein
MDRAVAARDAPARRGHLADASVLAEALHAKAPKEPGELGDGSPGELVTSPLHEVGIFCRRRRVH